MEGVERTDSADTALDLAIDACCPDWPYCGEMHPVGAAVAVGKEAEA